MGMKPPDFTGKRSVTTLAPSQKRKNGRAPPNPQRTAADRSDGKGGPSRPPHAVAPNPPPPPHPGPPETVFCSLPRCGFINSGSHAFPSSRSKCAPDKEDDKGTYDSSDKSGTLSGLVPAKRMAKVCRHKRAGDAEQGCEDKACGLVRTGVNEFSDHSGNEAYDDCPD